MTDTSEGPAAGMIHNSSVRHGLSALVAAIGAWIVSSNESASPFIVFGVVLAVGFVTAQFLERAVTQNRPDQG